MPWLTSAPAVLRSVPLMSVPVLHGALTDSVELVATAWMERQAGWAVAVPLSVLVGL